MNEKGLNILIEHYEELIRMNLERIAEDRQEVVAYQKEVEELRKELRAKQASPENLGFPEDN